MRLHRSLLLAAALASVITPVFAADFAWQGDGTTTPTGGSGNWDTSTIWENGVIGSIPGTSTVTITGSGTPPTGTDIGDVTTTVTTGATAVWTPANPLARTTGAIQGNFFFGGSGGDVVVSNNISLAGAKIFAEGGANYTFYAGSKTNPGILTTGSYVAATGNLRLVSIGGSVNAESRAKSTVTKIDRVIDLGQNGFDTTDITTFTNRHHTNSRTYDAATGVTTTTSSTYTPAAFVSTFTIDPVTGFPTFDYTYASTVTTTTSVTGGVDNPRQRLVLDSRDTATLTGALSGDGILVKEGSGTLQVNSSMAGFNGILEINGGELRVSGTLASQGVSVVDISTWFNGGSVGRGGNPLLGSWTEGRYIAPNGIWGGDLLVKDQGAVSTILRNNARLSFQNTPANFAQEPGGPFLLRTNGVRNLVSDINTELQTGLDSNYRISLESQTGFDSSIGILAGQGRFYKTGSGSLTVRNDSTFGGDILLAGGLTTLSSTGGKALYSANSVNLANVNNGATRGVNTVPVVNFPGFLDGNDRTAAIAPWTAPSLRLTNNQTIHNLQTKFYESQASMGGENGAATVNKWEPLIAGTGIGTRIELGTSTLTIVQDADGWYQGDIIGGVGSVLVKAGAATLVLDGTSSSFETLRVTGGKLVTNVQSLGSGTVDLSTGGLQIYQSNAATLNALLKSARGTVTEVGSSATINNGSVVTIGGGDAGVIQIKRFQSEFLGSLRIGDGVNLQLAADGGNTLGNAESVIIVNNLKADGTTLDRVTTLSFNDTDQILPTLVDTTVGSSVVSPAKSFARIDLGKGSITLRQSSAGSFAGDITGTGSLIKTGADFTLAGNVTYAGATVVQSGNLAVTTADGIRNTSALVLGTGAVFESAGQNQQIGALFGAAGSIVNMGAGTLTIGMDATREAAAIAESVADPASNTFLGTVATVDVNRTTAFLQNKAGLSAAEAASLAFAGDIRGTGELIKRGSQRLILSGVNTFTGATKVYEGVLQINSDSLANASGLEVSGGAALAVNVNDGDDRTFTRSVTGAGDFEKVGAGRLSLTTPLGLTGSLFAAAGTLSLSDTSGFTGNIFVGMSRDGRIDPTAQLEFVQTSNVTFTGSLSGPGTLVKSGSGVLTFTGNGGAFTGSVDVQGGELALASNPLPTGDINVASGAKLSASASNNPVYTGTLSGAGTVAVRDGILTVNTPSSSFTGVLSMSNGTVRAGGDNIYPEATIDLLAGSVFDLNGTIQTLSGVSGSSDTSVNLNAGILLVKTPSGMTTYEGFFSGNGQIEKSGAGTWRLLTTIDTGWTGSVTVNEGVLMATPQSLGAASVTVNLGSNSAAPGTLALLNEDPVNNVTYATAIDGDGVIGKSGVGVVSLTNASVNFAGSVSVTQGELRVETGSLGGSAFPTVSVSKDAIYAVVMNSDLTHDSSLLDNRVIGAGSLAVEGLHTLTLANGQSYTGNTILRSGASLNVTSLSTLNGLAGEVGTQVAAGGSLTIDQNTAGEFDGRFTTATALTVTGSAKLRLNDLTNISNLAVSGGSLVLDATEAASVALTNNGTLYFDTTATPVLFAGTVTGTGNLVKTGTGDLTLMTPGSFSSLAGFAGTLGVDSGRLTIAPSALPAGVTGLSTNGTGTLELSTTSAVETLAHKISGKGSLEKTGSGLLKINDVTGSDPYLKNFKGTFTINAGTIGGNFTTSGNLTVASGATMAPGNSPGTVTVNGNFTNSGTLDLEVTATGVSDKIVVNKVNGVDGVATLAAGTVFNVTQFGPGVIPRGTAYTVITAEGGVQAAEGDFVLSTGSRRVLIVTPSRNADINSPLFGLGSANAVTLYDVGTLQGSYSEHQGVSGMLGVLDTFTVNDAGLPDNRLGATLALTNAAALDKSVNNLSPLGFGSLYAMTRDTSLRHEDRIKERLEQRRYDNGGTSTSEWEAFVVGSAAMADNDTARDTPTFNYSTYGGMVGLDKKLSTGPVVGGAVGYDKGTATLHQDGGKVEMNRVRGTAFLSTMVTRSWFVDGGLSAGFGDFTTKRDTVLGRTTGSTTGFDIGANVVTGTVIVLQKDLHLTPHVGLSYSHHEFQGFTESGDAALKVDGWSNDSMRASVGTGLGWFIPSGDWTWKLGMDLAYNHELLDTESDLQARFARQGGNKFSSAAAALPGDSISMGPSATLNFDDDTSVTAGLTFEYGFDGRTYNNFNVSFRRRF